MDHTTPKNVNYIFLVGLEIESELRQEFIDRLVIEVEVVEEAVGVGERRRCGFGFLAVLPEKDLKVFEILFDSFNDLQVLLCLVPRVDDDLLLIDQLSQRANRN